ncbi:MAG: SMC family ATPase [Chloroflexi bacterium]|nr:SMC family ATPase [Chloroflexota bacterium]
MPAVVPMIPVSLTLRNFMCYRENVPTLHLDGVRVACLCGPNGHGKSALLDAMTWALWGKARGQRQEQLVHQGQREMQVELEFDAGDRRYRAIRRYARGGRSTQGHSSLELQMQTGEGYRPITGNSIADTEEKIRQLIGMDYDTFINSAFLLQGRADAFTMSTPAQRKEVLARVLGLELYERLEEQAKARVRDAQGRAHHLEGELEQLRREVTRRAEYEEALADINAQLAPARQSVEAATQRLEALRQRADHLRRQGERLAELERSLERSRQQLHELRAQQEKLQTRVREWQDLLSRREQVQDGHHRLAEARARLDALNQALMELNSLRDRLAPLERAIEQARAQLSAREHALLQHIERDLRPRVEAVPGLEQALARATEHAQALESRHQQNQEARTLAEELRMQEHALRSATEALRSQGKELREKLDLLSLHEHDREARCPLCQSALDAESRQRLARTYQEEIERCREQYRQNEAELKHQERERQRLETEVETAQRALDQERQQVQREHAVLSGRLEEARQAQQALERDSREREEHRRRLAAGEFAQEEQAQTRVLHQQIAALGYNAQAHQKAVELVRQLEPWDGEWRRLEEAERSLPQELESLRWAEALVHGAEEELRDGEAARHATQAELHDLPEVEQDLQGAETSHRETVERHTSLLSHRQTLEQRLAEVERMEREAKDRTSQLEAAREEAGLYTELATAFGKGGIQSLLIEAAIPRLEDEANRLLARMTDNRMTLKLETQREQRARPEAEPIETLEILTSDELGTRNYAMFSGGEAFRINFALRVALSKLLAWRAGAPLPSLFVDEGFGTQDTQGREKVLDVVRSIQEDFQRVIVITHLEDIKEAFPVRIEVTKTEEGSTFTMV